MAQPHLLLSAPDGGQPLSLHAYGGGQSLDVVRLVMPLTVDEEGRRARYATEICRLDILGDPVL